MPGGGDTRPLPVGAIVQAGPDSAGRPQRIRKMAYLLRSLAIIGAIAVHSPTHREADTATTQAAARRQEAPARGLDLRQGAESLLAAREAAEILAGLDPALREKVIALGLKAAASSR